MGTTGSVPRGRGVALPSGETVAVAASVTDRQTDRQTDIVTIGAFPQQITNQFLSFRLKTNFFPSSVANVLLDCCSTQLIALATCFEPSLHFSYTLLY